MVLPTTQFAYQKCLGTCDALMCVSHTLQSALESGHLTRIVQIDFSTALDRVNHRRSVAVLCMLYKIWCNPMHPLNGALPGPFVPVRVTRSGCTSVYLCAASLQNLAVPHNFYSTPLTVPLERSC